MMRRILARPLDTAALAALAEFPEVLQRVYAARRVADPAELNYSLSRMLPYQDLRGMTEAVQLLVSALREQAHILVVADFDADGATSCALMLRALREMGAARVSYLVPNRFEYGYGLTPEIVAVAARSEPDLIVTVDNGIASLAGVQAALERGMQVLITDHHLPGKELPAAQAIVNPNQPDDRFASKNLAGVGVSFYLMAALRARLRELDWFQTQGRPEPNLARLLELVALGTVADVVPLDANNRILVSQGLARIRAQGAIVGIRALAEVAKRQPVRLTSTDLGFAVGPRLNAAGRLDDMSLGIECLLTDDPGAARVMAQKLDGLNRERRGLEAEMQAQADSVLAGLQLGDGESLPYGLCLYQSGWHQGVVGILASRIKERWHRPVIAFADAGDDEIKGSARSVPGVHIRDVLDAVATANPGLVERFGGHAMAAGLSLKRAHFEAFSAAFDGEVRRYLQASDLQGVLHSDGALSASDIDLPLAERLRDAGPWGQAFPEPLFDGEFELVNRRVVGEHHLKMVVRAPGQAALIDAIAFRTVDHDWPERVERVHLAYRLDVNEFRGNRSAQLVVEQVELL